MRVAILAICAVLALALLPAEVMAHPGALDADGCNRQRKAERRLCYAGHIRPGEHRRYVGLDGVVRHFSH